MNLTEWCKFMFCSASERFSDKQYLHVMCWDCRLLTHDTVLKCTVDLASKLENNFCEMEGKVVAKNQFLAIFRRLRITIPRRDCNLIMSLICDKGVTTQNLAFLSYWFRKKRLQIRFEQVYCHNTFYKTRRWRAVVSSLHSIENYCISKPLKASPEK